MLACLLAAVSILPVEGQPHQSFPLDKYDELYELIFPRVSDAGRERELEYRLYVRVRPSFKASYQVAVLKDHGLPMRVLRHDLKNRKESLGYQVNDLLKDGIGRDPKILASKLAVVRREISEPSSSVVNTIRTFFGLEHKFTKDTGITLDGVGYDIWYKDSSSEVKLSLSGGETFEVGESPLITWARKLGKTTEK